MPSTLLHRSPSTTTTTRSSDHHHHTKRHQPYHLLPQNLTHQLHHDSISLSSTDHATILAYHTHRLNPNQASSAIIQTIPAPAHAVWSLLSRFDNPQEYKPFLNDCRIVSGNGTSVGSVREVSVVSGLPATSSTERLEILDHDRRAFGFLIVGGENRLVNYRSVTTLHQVRNATTVAVESYVVDVPEGNSKEEACVFVDTIVRCNLRSLAEKMINKTEASSSSISPMEY